MEARLEHADELDDIIADWMSERTREEVIDIFEKHEAAISPVNNMSDIFDDKHFDDRDAIIYVEDDNSDEEVAMRGVFPKLSETPGSVKHTGPEIGSHALNIITEMTDKSADEVRQLADEGVTTIGWDKND